MVQTTDVNANVRPSVDGYKCQTNCRDSWSICRIFRESNVTCEQIVWNELRKCKASRSQQFAAGKPTQFRKGVNSITSIFYVTGIEKYTLKRTCVELITNFLKNCSTKIKRSIIHFGTKKAT